MVPRSQPPDDPESPFLAEQLFVQESAGEWNGRVAAMEMESAFLQDFTGRLETLGEPRETEASLDDEEQWTEAGDSDTSGTDEAYDEDELALSELQDELEDEFEHMEEDFYKENQWHEAGTEWEEESETEEALSLAELQDEREELAEALFDAEQESELHQHLALEIEDGGEFAAAEMEGGAELPLAEDWLATEQWFAPATLQSDQSDEDETDHGAIATDDFIDAEAPAARVVFPSGVALAVVRGLPENKDDDYWDPWSSGNPLLDTGPDHKDKRLSANFTVRELTTSGGRSADVARIDPRLVECLQALREQVGKAVTITSGYRSWKRNKQVYAGRKNKDGTPRKPTLSQHCSGRAADIKIAGMNGLEIGKAAIRACGPNIGVGLGKNFAHIDVRNVAAAWNYGGVDDAWISEIKRYQRQRGGVPGSPRPGPATTGPGSGPPAKPSAERVRFAQHVLNIAEGERLKVDGDLGKLTGAALQRFRTKYALGRSGLLDRSTELVLAQRALEELAQQSLFAKSGALDAKTEQALRAFKGQHGLRSGATLDAATRAALLRALGARNAAPRSPAPPPRQPSSQVKTRGGGWGGWKGRSTTGAAFLRPGDISDKYELAVAVAAQVETGGAFDKVQMYDKGILSWGIKQWTLHRGSLQKALAFIKNGLAASGQSSLWTQLFPRLDIRSNELVVNGRSYATPRKDGDAADIALRRVFRGREAPEQFDAGAMEQWLTLFALAGRHPTIQALQIQYAVNDLKANLNRQLGAVLRARNDVRSADAGNYRRVGDYIEHSPLALAIFNSMETQNPKWAYLTLKKVVDGMARKNGATYDTLRWAQNWRETFTADLQNEFSESGVACWGRRAISQKPHCRGRTSRAEKTLAAYRKLSGRA